VQIRASLPFSGCKATTISPGGRQLEFPALG
jgi:hypothetical protein